MASLNSELLTDGLQMKSLRNNVKLNSIITLLNDGDGFTESNEDDLFQEFFVVVEVLCKFYTNVKHKLKETEAAYESVKQDLDVTKKTLQAREDEPTNCSHCGDVERELAIYKKKLQQNESRIKSIANILSLHGTQDVEDKPRSVSKAFDLVSQMLLGGDETRAKKRGRPDSGDVETLAMETMKMEVMHSPLCLPETPCATTPSKYSQKQPVMSEMTTPTKENSQKQPKLSPVLGSASKRVHNKKELEESPPGTWVSPSLLRPSSESMVPPDSDPSIRKKQADFWQLKTTHNVDIEPLKVGKGRKLKQAQLTLGCFTTKQELSSLEDFTGGIRPSRTSTQRPPKQDQELLNEEEMLQKAINESLKETSIPEEDVVDKSPISAENKKRKRQLAGSSRNTEADLDATEFVTQAKSHSAAKQEFPHRGKAVRKKAERKQLAGWDCDSCKRYYEAVGDRQKEHVKLCSRHRDKYAFQPLTPKGYWDPDFPDTQQFRERNLDVTHYGAAIR